MSDEIILCIKKDAGARVVSMYEAGGISMLDALCTELSNIHAYSRQYLDKRKNGVDAEGKELPTGDPDYWQLLPYLIFNLRLAGTEDVLPFIYKRTKLVGESRLVGNSSCGIGGHIAVNSGVEAGWIYVGFDAPAFTDREDFETVFRMSVDREVEEEVCGEDGGPVAGYDFDSLNDHSFIVDHSNAVGRLHLGIAYHIDVYEPVKCKEEELESVGHLTRDQILAMPNHENWTKLMFGIPL